MPVAAIIAVAANTEGRREIVGPGIGSSEAETFWTGFLRSLRARGLGGVRLVISSRRQNGPPDHLVPRIDPYRPQGRHCTGVRGDLAALPRSPDQERAGRSPSGSNQWRLDGSLSRGLPAVAALAIVLGPMADNGSFRQAFDQPDRAHAGRPHGRLRARPAGLHVLPAPAPHQAAQHQSIERLDKEVKRRADLVGVIPNEVPIMRPIGAVLFEQNQEWQTSSRSMMVAAFARIDTEETGPILAITTKAAWPCPQAIREIAPA